MNIRKRDLIELRIDKMAYGGRGLARKDGFVIFVKGAVPGDTVVAGIYRKKKDFAEANIVEIAEPSPDRIQAPCPYSGWCGGCQWQQIRYDRQLIFKKEHVEECLSHIASLKAVAVRDTIPSENIFAYRNKMEFSFSDRRWFLPHELDRRNAEGGVALGLHVPGTYNKVIDIDACLLQAEEGNRILRDIKQFVKNSGIPVYNLKTHEGVWRFLALRHSSALDEWMINIVTSREIPDVARELAGHLVRKHPRITSVINNISRRKAAVATGEREIVIRGNSCIADRIGSFTFQISANSFFQTNSAGAKKLYQTVMDYADFKGHETVLDLYSGTGTIAVFLASRVRHVTGIEISESAVRDARTNCKINRIENCRFICGDIREKLGEITRKPDILIIDPPRAGMHKDVLTRVLEIAPETIVYVSCNPATMARDVGRMTHAYKIVEIQPVDMFPHTYHIEAVVKLVRSAEGRMKK